MVVCGDVIIKGNDMFEDFLLINIKVLAVAAVILLDDADDVDDEVEDNKRFSATEEVLFDVAVKMLFGGIFIFHFFSI
jgi:hypothetical protein